MTDWAKALQGLVPGASAPAATPILAEPVAKLAAAPTSLENLKPAFSLQDSDALRTLSEYLHKAPREAAKRSTSAQTVTDASTEEQGVIDSFKEWLGTPRGFNSNLATASSDAEVLNPDQFPAWYEDVYGFSKEVMGAASAHVGGPTRQAIEFLSGRAASQQEVPVYDKSGRVVGKSKPTSQELEQKAKEHEEFMAANYSRSARTVALVAESFADPLSYVVGGVIGPTLKVAAAVKKAAQMERAALRTGGKAAAQDLAITYAKEHGSILLPAAAVATGSLVWEGTNAALEQLNTYGEVDIEKVAERGATSAGFAVAITGALGVSVYAADRLIRALVKTGVAAKDVVRKVQEIGYAQRKALDSGLSHEEATKRGLRAVGLPTQITDDALEFAATARQAEATVAIPPDEQLAAALRRENSVVPDHVPDPATYAIEVRKNGAVVHVAKADSEETALAKAQKMADATRVPVRVIDPKKADGVTVVRPTPLGELLPGQRGSVSGKPAKPYFWEVRKDGGAVQLGEAEDEALALLKAQQAADETGVSVRLVDPNRADGVKIVRPAAKTKQPLGQIFPKQGGFLGWRSKPPQPGHSVEPDVPGLGRYALTPIHSAMKDIAPSLAERVRRTDFEVLARVDGYTKQALPWLAGFKKLPQDVKEQVTLFLNNSDYGGAELVLTQAGHADLNQHLRAIRPLYEQMYNDQVMVGINVAKDPNHYGRHVRDYKGLSKQLMGTERTSLDRAIAEASSAKKRQLTDAEKEQVIATTLRNARFKTVGSVSTKERKVDVVTDKELPYYSLADEALERDIERVARNVEVSRMWGPEMAGALTSSPTQLETIGRLTRDAVLRGEITAQEQIDVLSRMFQNLYGAAKKTSPVVSGYRNLTYSTLVAQFSTAVQNMTDLAYSAYKFGAFGAAKAAIQQMSNRGVHIADLHIQNAIAEISEKGFGAEVMDKAFRISGFRRLDELAKGNIVTAARNFYATPANVAKAHAKWDEKLGGAQQVDAALQSMRPGGTLNADAKYMLVSELADVAPVLRSELPEGWHAHPNARVLYALHTYQLKQLDTARREIFQIAKVDPQQAAKNMVALVGYLAAAQTSVGWIIDFVRNRPLEPASEKVAASMLKMVGLSAYSANARHLGFDDDRRPDLTGFLADVVFPPTTLFANVYDDIRNAGSQFKSLQHLPGVGRFLYDWFGGGVEALHKRAAREAREQKKEQREALRPEALKATREQIKQLKQRVKGSNN